MMDEETANGIADAIEGVARIVEQVADERPDSRLRLCVLALDKCLEALAPLLDGF